MRQTLIELGHPQPRTPMQIDNATAHALLKNKILPKALKAMDMRFQWLTCREAQGQFCYYRRLGTQNLANYFTKHHPASHHKNVRPTILTSVNDPEYRIQEILCDTRNVITSDQIQTCQNKQRTTNKKINSNKIVCQNSLRDSQVPKHDRSKLSRLCRFVSCRFFS